MPCASAACTHASSMTLPPGAAMYEVPLRAARWMLWRGRQPVAQAEGLSQLRTCLREGQRQR
jgi:hypothetical protein